MAHWRTMVGERTYFDIADLNGRDLTVQIESYRQGVLTGVINGVKSETRVALVKFVGYDRPLAFKTTLSQSMFALYGTGDASEWIGKWITVYPAVVKVKGVPCEAVRIRPIVPTPQMIAAAQANQPGSSKRAPRTETIDPIVSEVCAAIDAATTEHAIESAIAPHRDRIKSLDRRAQTIVLSAKNARLATLGLQSSPSEGTQS